MSAILIPDAPSSNKDEAYRHSHVGRKGNLTIELWYGRFGDRPERQAALLIYRNNPLEGVFVPLAEMWRFAERDALHALAGPLAAKLYGFVTRDDCIRVLDAVLDYLEDLKNSPPDPAMFKDRSLDHFLAGCEDEGLSFFVDVNGERLVG